MVGIYSQAERVIIPLRAEEINLAHCQLTTTLTRVYLKSANWWKLHSNESAGIRTRTLTMKRILRLSLILDESPLTV